MAALLPPDADVGLIGGKSGVREDIDQMLRYKLLKPRSVTVLLTGADGPPAANRQRACVSRSLSSTTTGVPDANADAAADGCIIPTTSGPAPVINVSLLSAARTDALDAVFVNFSSLLLHGSVDSVDQAVHHDTAAANDHAAYEASQVHVHAADVLDAASRIVRPQGLLCGTGYGSALTIDKTLSACASSSLNRTAAQALTSTIKTVVDAHISKTGSHLLAAFMSSTDECRPISFCLVNRKV